MAASPGLRVEEQPVYLLHSHPYRETSLIVDVFSRDHGRVGLLSKGARRPTSQVRGVLMAFRPLLADWSGGGEVKTLVRAEWQGGLPLLAGRSLLCGYYLNELLLRLTAREDPHPELFSAYDTALRALALRTDAEALVLRRFELALLQNLGYGLHLAEVAATGEAVRPEGRYRVVAEEGVVEALAEDGGDPALPGRVLLALSEGDLSAPETQAHAKRLLRRLIQQQLGGLPLHSRRILMELQEL